MSTLIYKKCFIPPTYIVHIFLGDELRQKIETERSEIERLHQEIAELQEIRDDLYEEDDSEDDSSSSSEDEDELQENLQKLIRENQELQVCRLLQVINYVLSF